MQYCWYMIGVACSIPLSVDIFPFPASSLSFLFQALIHLICMCIHLSIYIYIDIDIVSKFDFCKIMNSQTSKPPRGTVAHRLVASQLRAALRCRPRASWTAFRIRSASSRGRRESSIDFPSISIPDAVYGIWRTYIWVPNVGKHSMEHLGIDGDVQ